MSMQPNIGLSKPMYKLVHWNLSAIHDWPSVAHLRDGGGRALQRASPAVYKLWLHSNLKPLKDFSFELTNKYKQAGNGPLLRSHGLASLLSSSNVELPSEAVRSNVIDPSKVAGPA